MNEVEYEKDMNAVVWQENKWFVAQCLEVDIASQGKTEMEALENLCDALVLHFTPLWQPFYRIANRLTFIDNLIRR